MKPKATPDTISSEALYKQEVIHQINLALSRCLTEYPNKIEDSINNFGTTWNRVNMAGVYSEIIKTTDTLSNLGMNYTAPASLIYSYTEGGIRRRLWDAEERQAKGLEMGKDEFIKYMLKEYRIDLRHTDWMPVEYAECEIHSSEYFKQELIPTQIHNHEKVMRPEEFNDNGIPLTYKLLEVLDHKNIIFDAGVAKAIIAPNIEEEKDIRRDKVYFVDSNNRRYNMPEVFDESRRITVQNHLLTHVRKSYTYQQRFLNAVNQKVREYDTIKNNQKLLGVWDDGTITDNQTPLLLNLVRENMRFSTEEKIAIVAILPTLSSGKARELITWFINEKGRK
jgi:hypothetical protein